MPPIQPLSLARSPNNQPNVPFPTSQASVPFGEIRLSNAHQEGLFNLFNGYATQTPAPTGEELLHQIREDFGPRGLVDPMITVIYEIYKKIRAFLSNHGVDTPSTGASGGLIVNRLLHTIWHLPGDEVERTKAIAQFRAIKRGEFVPSSQTAGVLSPTATPFPWHRTRVLKPSSHHNPWGSTSGPRSVTRQEA